MKSFDTDIQKYTHKTRLKAAERAELRERLVSYMEYHPLPEQTVRKMPVRAQQFAFGPFVARIASLNNTLYTRIASGALAVLLIAVVPFAAENAAPGDVLYPIKTKFNEPILAQFNTSPYEKVAFETELMERRIAEARLLAKEGKLTEETEAALAASVAGHAVAVQQGIDALKESDAEGAAIAEITFGSTLDVQTAVLGSTSGSGTESIASAVREAKSAVDAQKGTTTPSYERLMAHVEQETTRAYELFNTIRQSATSEEKAQIEQRLKDVSGKIATAQDAHATAAADAGTESESESEAVTGTNMLMATKSVPEPVNSRALLSTTLGDLKKLIVFMTDIDVRNAVALETLVPSTPTSDETAAAKLEALMTRYDALTEQVTVRATSSIDITTEYDALSTLMQSALTARDAGNTEELAAAIADLTLMTENLEAALIEPEVEGAATSTSANSTTPTTTRSSAPTMVR